MSVSPPLTRTIGQTERALQALIATQLAPAGASFAEWAALTLIHGARRMTREQLGAMLAAGHIAEGADADAVVDALMDRALITGDSDALALTAAGATFYEPLRAAIGGITDTLVAGISPDDLDATRRTLDIVARRAGELSAGR